MSNAGITIIEPKAKPKLLEYEIDAAIDHFKLLSAFDALECLCLVMGAGEAKVKLNGTYSCTLKELMDTSQFYEGEMAYELPITFYGGPPNTCELFDGTLLTLLVDHFLFNFVLNKQDQVDKALSYA